MKKAFQQLAVLFLTCSMGVTFGYAEQPNTSATQVSDQEQLIDVLVSDLMLRDENSFRVVIRMSSKIDAAVDYVSFNIGDNVAYKWHAFSTKGNDCSVNIQDTRNIAFYRNANASLEYLSKNYTDPTHTIDKDQAVYALATFTCTDPIYEGDIFSYQLALVLKHNHAKLTTRNKWKRHTFTLEGQSIIR